VQPPLVATRPRRIAVLPIGGQSGPRDAKLELLNQQPDLIVADPITPTAPSLSLALAHSPDIALIDLLPDPLVALEVCRAIGERRPATRTVVLSADQSAGSVHDAMRAGSWGYLVESEPPARIGAALRAVAGGCTVFSESVAHTIRRLLAPQSTPSLDGIASLTAREADILRHLTLGLPNREIAGALRISTRTVDAHIRQVLLKLGVRTRTEAAIRAVRGEVC
jgi:DNA-binding NarL/FixJ family response regulator